jgi:hypothetical protein
MNEPPRRSAARRFIYSASINILIFPFEHIQTSGSNSLYYNELANVLCVFSYGNFSRLIS